MKLQKWTGRGALVMALAGTFVAIAPAKSARADNIQWAASWNAAQKAAVTQNKPMMVDFYTDWCGWCKKLDKDTYTDANVVKVAKSFVSLKLNAEKEGTALAKKYQVDGFPCIMFLDPQGRVLNRVNGYLPGDDFSTEMKTALTRFNSIKTKTFKKPAKTTTQRPTSAAAAWQKQEAMRRAKGKPAPRDVVLLSE